MVCQPTSCTWTREHVWTLARQAPTTQGTGARNARADRRRCEWPRASSRSSSRWPVGATATIVLIPTTLEDVRLTPDGLAQLRTSMAGILGVQHVVVLHTRDRREADTAAFVEPLRHASGVWVLGGNEDYLMDAYTGTRTETEITALLARDDVIAGTSAGAIANRRVRIGSRHERRLQGAHYRPQTHPLRPAIKRRGAPSLESAVAPERPVDNACRGARSPWDRHRRGHSRHRAAESPGKVLGDGHVGIYDGRDHNGKPYIELSAGQHFDLKTRMTVPAS